MKAISFQAPKQIACIDVSGPARPGPGEALVRVHRVGICGTDISGYLGKMPLFSYPRIPGHELGVEVLAVGDGVANIRPGDRCSVEPYINDPNSYASRRGRPNCCDKLEVLGVHRDGGLRREILLPARKLHPSRKLAFEQLALVETLAIGCHAVWRGDPKADESVLIIGAGPIGLATLEFVKLTGAKLIMMDTNESRLEFCRKAMDVRHTLRPSANLIQDLRELTDGHLPDVVFDATGNAESMSAAFGYVAQGGRLVYVGITSDEVRLKHATFHKCEGTLLCTRNALPQDFTRIIGLIEDGKIDTNLWITHRTRFDDLVGVFPSFTKPETGVIKAMVAIEE